MNDHAPGRYETSGGVPFALELAPGGFVRRFDAVWFWDDAAIGRLGAITSERAAELVGPLFRAAVTPQPKDPSR